MLENNNFDRNDTSKYIFKNLINIKNPIILELGVNKGQSTKKFVEHVSRYGGEVFSIDIKDCSNVLKSDKWNFLISNDLNFEKIINNFPKLKNGIDLLYIDSYHDETHVKKLLETWFIYVKKFGYIYFDDTESYLYKKKKKFDISAINDSINKLIENFYYQNYDQLIYVKYFSGSGLSEFFKLSDLGSKPNLSTKLWNYNFFLAKIYLYLKKILYRIKKKHKI